MSTPESSSLHPPKQEKSRRRRARRPRTRCCLLKGCRRRFRPQQASERYCSRECRQEARKWYRWKAQQKYRAKPTGKMKRLAQSQRHRDRGKNSGKPAGEAVDGVAWVIQRKYSFDCSCDRPGCYERFDRRPRSPEQRFCSRECRRAMERVWERERRWKRNRSG